MTRTAADMTPEVLIMAGGRGSRMGHLTAHAPKPMLPVNGRPVLEHVIDHLRDQGVTHMFLSVGYLAEVITSYFGNGRWLGVNIDYVVERCALDTAGAVGLLPPVDRPLLVINGDLLTNLPVVQLVCNHLRHNAGLTVCLAEARRHIPYGVVECDADGALVQLLEKPTIVMTVVSGIYLLAPEVVRHVPSDVPLSMPDLIRQVRAGGGRVRGFALPGRWLDVGSPEDYRRACELHPVLTTTPTAGGELSLSATIHGAR